MKRGLTITWLLALGLLGSALAPACDGGTAGLTGTGAEAGASATTGGEQSSINGNRTTGGAQGSAGGSEGLTGGGMNGSGGAASAPGSMPGQGAGGALSGAGASSLGSGGLGTGGILVLPGDECQTVADCTACAWDTAPRNPGECYCAFCGTIVMSTARCDVNQKVFKEQRCDKKVCPKDPPQCAAKQVACLPDPNRAGVRRCVDPAAVTASGGAPGVGGSGSGGAPGAGGSGGATGATFCTTPTECTLTEYYPRAPKSSAECYCPHAECPVALNKATAVANQAAYDLYCPGFANTPQCLNAPYPVCPAIADVTCVTATQQCTPTCRYPRAPVVQTDCYCTDAECPLPIAAAACQANEAAWKSVCANWLGYCPPQTLYCGEFGPRPPAPTECRYNLQDCAPCQYPAAPTGAGDCYCPQAQCLQALNSVTCNANQAAWRSSCEAWSAAACAQVQPPTCGYVEVSASCNRQNACELITY